MKKVKIRRKAEWIPRPRLRQRLPRSRRRMIMRSVSEDPSRKRKRSTLSTVGKFLLFFIFLEPPSEKPDEKFDPEVKRMNELMRRWKVHIFQIEVVNMTKEPIDPFLQIIIGGNYYVRLLIGVLTVANNRSKLKSYQGVTCSTIRSAREV